MEFEEIIKLSIDLRSITNRLKKENLYDSLLERTSFLPIDSTPKERIFCIRNSITDRKICNNENCNSYTKFRSVVGYSKYCSIKCNASSGESMLLRKKTCIEKYGSEHHMKSSKFMDKFKENNIILFGVDNVSKLDDVKEKKKLTFQKNYGFDHIFSSNELKGKYFKEKYGYDPYIPKENKSEFEKYKDEVWRITYHYKKKLIKNWIGYDYYDNEYIKENYKLDYNNNSYPSIDHKISVYDGFINKIDPSIIADINNLCITKRSINKKKGVLSEVDFIEKFY